MMAPLFRQSGVITLSATTATRNTGQKLRTRSNRPAPKSCATIAEHAKSVPRIIR